MTDAVTQEFTERVVVRQVQETEGFPVIFVKVEGDHESEEDGAPTTLAYVVAMTMHNLFTDGTVFQRIEKDFGISLTGKMSVETE